MTHRAPVGAYVRVSSATQTHDLQVQAIERACKARGDAFPLAWYRDTLTGGKLKRPALDALRADARAGKLTRLYVYRLDRLTRSGIRDTFEVVQELERHGCELVTIADGFDLSGPLRDPLLAMLAWAAQVEREAIAERIRAAREAIRAKGGTWGRPSRVDDRLLAKARALAAKGRSVRAIAIALKIPRATIGRALAR